MLTSSVAILIRAFFFSSLGRARSHAHYFKIISAALLSSKSSVSSARLITEVYRRRRHAVAFSRNNGEADHADIARPRGDSRIDTLRYFNDLYLFDI